VTRLLASVASLEEARIAAACGVDIIDLKNPLAGALGALQVAVVEAIVAERTAAIPLSATVGDLPMLPEIVHEAVASMAATGVDYVKIGFFPGGDRAGVLNALRPLADDGVRLIAVLFADQPLSLDWLSELAQASFAGAMLDTADKRRGALTELRDLDFLGDFVGTARRQGLLCGLAGSLRLIDVPQLRTLGADYLGFRGALCGGKRTDALNAAAITALLDRIRAPLVTTDGWSSSFSESEAHALSPYSSRAVPT
jgi:uncharacterized protein (UPF0264 family)